MDQILKYLERIPAGNIKDTTELEEALAVCWDDFTGDSAGMTPTKLYGRMEQVIWDPPILKFVIERHGATVMGSSRAELQYWELNVEQKTTRLCDKGYRQLKQRQSAVDTKTIAEELTELIKNRHNDERLQWSTDVRLRILSGNIFPADSAKKQTLEGRKKRLVKDMEKRLFPIGWKRKGAWWVRNE